MGDAGAGAGCAGAGGDGLSATHRSVLSNVENVTVASAVSPSFFLSELVNGVAWVIGTAAHRDARHRNAQ
jgi:hypothetical protein